ncbi:sugar phosphate isomerase/epimerase, partial [Acidobacteria bacterium AH-259-A15]|nr:sugar phosphate isomerase/epimerase [Acidobacteria bacterium AH-259-A15]
AAAMSGAAWASGIGPAHRREGDRPSKVKVCIFSKHLQWLGYPEMAATAAEIGFDGIDLTVRPRGHVLPERVERDLPKAVEAAKVAGIEIPMMTTAITDPADPRTEAILKTASKFGIRYYRLGYYRYEDSKEILETLADAKPQLRGLAKLNEQYKIRGDYQNHAGSNYVGGPVWDLWELTRDIDPQWIGCQFDIRHATVEGASSWPIGFRILSSRIHTVVAKDFKWVKTERGWKVENCPLGEGLVNFTQFFSMLAKTGFAGPVTLHFEYPLGGANRGARELTIDKSRVIESMHRDLTVLRGWLKKAAL